MRPYTTNSAAPVHRPYMNDGPYFLAAPPAAAIDSLRRVTNCPEITSQCWLTCSPTTAQEFRAALATKVWLRFSADDTAVQFDSRETSSAKRPFCRSLVSCHYFSRPNFSGIDEPKSQNFAKAANITRREIPLRYFTFLRVSSTRNEDKNTAFWPFIEVVRRRSEIRRNMEHPAGNREVGRDVGLT